MACPKGHTLVPALSVTFAVILWSSDGSACGELDCRDHLEEIAGPLAEQGQRRLSVKGFLGSVPALQAPLCCEELEGVAAIFANRMVSDNFQCSGLSE